MTAQTQLARSSDQAAAPGNNAKLSENRLPAQPATEIQTHDEQAAAAQVQRIVRSVVQAALEVLAGSRPLQQMADWLDPASYERLQLRTNLVRTLSRGQTTAGREDHLLHRNVSVRTVRTCRVTPLVYEASAVTYENHRARAVALRLEHRRGHWTVTALEIG